MIVNPYTIGRIGSQRFGYSWGLAERWSGSWLLAGRRKWSRSWGHGSTQDKVSRR